jgi:hypothetical protein
MLIQNEFLKPQRLEKGDFLSPIGGQFGPLVSDSQACRERGHRTAMAGVQSLLSEAHALRRYSDASERQRRQLLGEL